MIEYPEQHNIERQQYSRPTPYQQPAAAPEMGRGRDTLGSPQKPAGRVTGRNRSEWSSQGIVVDGKPTAIIRHSSIRASYRRVAQVFAIAVYLLSALANVGGFDGGFVLAVEGETHLLMWRMPSPLSWGLGIASLIALTYVQLVYSPMRHLQKYENKIWVPLEGIERAHRVLMQLSWQYIASILAGAWLTMTAFKAALYPIALDIAGGFGLFSAALTPTVAWILYGAFAVAVEALPEDILVSED